MLVAEGGVEAALAEPGHPHQVLQRRRRVPRTASQNWSRTARSTRSSSNREHTTGQLDSKTALVTGGSTGIGLAVARRFVEEGARVYVTGRRKPELDAAIEVLGDGAVGIPGDVSDLDDLDRLFDAVSAGGRGLDAVFANAGGDDLATIAELTPQSLDTTFATNVRGTASRCRRPSPC